MPLPRRVNGFNPNSLGERLWPTVPVVPAGAERTGAGPVVAPWAGAGDVGGVAGPGTPITTAAPTPGVPVDWPWAPMFAATSAAKEASSAFSTESN